jgi:hypothetical protein
MEQIQFGKTWKKEFRFLKIVKHKYIIKTFIQKIDIESCI